MDFKRNIKIPFGTTANGEIVYIDYSALKYHLEIIGSTGEGKSKFMENIIRHLIAQDQGLCLLDPHGSLYEAIVMWCDYRGFLNREGQSKKIVLLDCTQGEWSFGFNPLGNPYADTSVIVDSMVEACSQVWGGEDTSKTPLLKRCLKIMFHALAEKKMSLLESRFFLKPGASKFLEYFTKDLSDPFIRDQWEGFENLRRGEFENIFGSSNSRMLEFLGAPNIRNIVGQKEKFIDFKQAMDEGWIVLVNLSSKGKVSPTNAKLLGTLLVNDMFQTALKRQADQSRPFYLMIDECERFMNSDLAGILDECRKFGLHLMISHQTLEQVRDAGEKIYSSVMNNAKTKIVFGGLFPKEAKELAELMHFGFLNLEEPKKSLNKPVAVGQERIKLENYTFSRGTSESESETDNWSDSEGTSHATGHSENWAHNSSFQRTINIQHGGDGSFGIRKALSHGISHASGGGVSSMHGSSQSRSTGGASSHSTTQSEAEAWGWSEALQTIYEERPSQVFSLEEQLHKAGAMLSNQLPQHAIIKIPKNAPIYVKTPTIKTIKAKKEWIDDFTRRCYESAYFIQRTETVRQEIEKRHMAIEAEVIEMDRIEEPTTFREPVKKAIKTKKPKEVAQIEHIPKETIIIPKNSEEDKREKVEVKAKKKTPPKKEKIELTGNWWDN